jgi:hypothetical protein
MATIRCFQQLPQLAVVVVEATELQAVFILQTQVEQVVAMELLAVLAQLEQPTKATKVETEAMKLVVVEVVVLTH